MSRYWDAASDLDACPPQDHGYWGESDPEHWRVIQLEQEAAYDAANYGEYLRGERGERRARHGAESPRRQALFRKAEAAMRVMVALRGVYGPPVTITAWYGGHGRRLGLFGYYDNDHELQWEPRRGFRVLEIAEIPF